VRDDEGIVASSWAFLSPVFSMDNSLTLLMLLPVLVSCAGCHWVVLTGRRRRRSAATHRRQAVDHASDNAFPSNPIAHPA
jgi:hypothetical protein